MVQGGQLMAHLGGDHGDGEASGVESSLQQGTRTGSSGDPEIGIAAAAEQWGKSRNGAPPQGYQRKTDIYAKEGHQGRPHLTRRQGGAASPLAAPGTRMAEGGPPLAPFGLLESSGLLIFYMIF